MTNQDKILASSKEWKKTEEDHLEEWERVMIAAMGKEKYLEIKMKEYRAELTASIIRGTIYLIAIAILCVAFLYLR